MSKTVQISSRITQDDAAWLGAVKIEGATTPSDKLRVIIAEARQRREGQQDYRASIRLAHELLSPTWVTVREREHQQQIHSEVVARVMDWMPDLIGYVVSHDVRLRTTEGGGDQGMREFESGLTDRVFRLMESILQLGVTERCACFDGMAVRRRMQPIRDLVNAITPVEEK